MVRVTPSPTTTLAPLMEATFSEKSPEETKVTAAAAAPSPFAGSKVTVPVVVIAPAIREVDPAQKSMLPEPEVGGNCPEP